MMSSQSVKVELLAPADVLDRSKANNRILFFQYKSMIYNQILGAFDF